MDGAVFQSRVMQVRISGIASKGIRNWGSYNDCKNSDV